MGKEWDSEKYHRLSDRQFEWGLKVLARLHLRGDERVLDAGCGTGRVTAQLVKRLPGGSVVAVDRSENMLSKARETLGSAAPVEFVSADLVELSFENEFDGVFSTAVFHWIKDHDRLFASLSRALKPGGWLEAQCGGGPNIRKHRERANRLIARPEYAKFFAGWAEPWEFASAELTKTRLERAGFNEVKTWLEPAGFKLGTKQEYRDYMKSVTLHQHLEQITDPALREKFVDELVEEAVNDPEFELDYWRLNIQAKKSTTETQHI